MHPSLARTTWYSDCELWTRLLTCLLLLIYIEARAKRGQLPTPSKIRMTRSVRDAHAKTLALSLPRLVLTPPFDINMGPVGSASTPVCERHRNEEGGIQRSAEHPRREHP